MRAVVFAGPSLGPATTPPPGVTFAPPAVAGDLYLAAREGVAVIGLVDGAFEDRATVWHKEILYALSQGCRVIGAASLGALRAVECTPFGMEGVGEIFARFESGALEDDAELALSFGPAEMGYPALSTPLINVRATLETAEAAGVIDAAAAGALLSCARGMFFKDLGWSALLAEARGAEIEVAALDRLAAWLPGHEVDLKRSDARSLVAAVGAALAEPLPPAPDFRFAESRVWALAVTEFDQGTGALSARELGVLDEMRLNPVRFEAALTRAFARRAARGNVEEAQVSEEALIEDLRTRLELRTAEEFRGWLAAVEGTPQSLARALGDEERLRDGLEAAADELASAMLDEARIEGGYEEFAARAEAKAALLAGGSAARYDEAELAALIDALCARRRISVGVEDFDLLARALGLADRRALHRLLRAEEDFIAAQRRERRA